MPFKITLVDLVAMREVRKQYAAFMTYAVGLGKLTQWDHPEGDGVPVGTAELLEYMAGDDMDQWAAAYRKLMWEAGANQHRLVYGSGWTTSWLCDKKRVDAHLTHMVKKVHASEVLVRVTLPLGEHKKDPNHKYRREM